MNRDWAKDLLRKIDDAKKKANKDPRSTEVYWNCDNFGSIQGIRDAEEWVNNQITDCVLKHAMPKEDVKALLQVLLCHPLPEHSANYIKSFLRGEL